MKHEDFERLESAQQRALLAAMYVRNALEGFHVEHLTDAQMKELNPIVRNALYDVFKLMTCAGGPGRKAEKAQRLFATLAMAVPDYWELPELSDIVRDLTTKS